MTTKINRTVAREVEIGGRRYTVRLSTRGIKVTRKGFRIGAEFSWEQLVRPAAERTFQQ